MNWKYIPLFLIGIIMGSALSIGMMMYNPQFLGDVLPSGNKSMYNDLFIEYQNSTYTQEEALSKLDELQEENERLAYDYEVISEELFELMVAYNETIESYESLLMQYQIVTGTAPLSPHTQSNDTIHKDFAWIYDGKTWTLSLNIPEHLYGYYSNKTRIPTEDYSVYVTHPYDDDFISTIISKFDDIAIQEGYNDKKTVNLVVSFVQSLPYTFDNVSTVFDEYPRYPLETLVDGGGDCEDTSILASALLDAMGYNVVLINPTGHVGVGVDVDAYGVYWMHEGTRYFYVETTGEGWELGELPEEYQEEPAQIYPILPIPVCTHDWTASVVQHRLTIVADIQNVGTAKATGIKLFVALEGERGEIWNPTESAFIDLEVGEETTVMLELSVPRRVRTRIIVQVLDPWRNVMDESYSEWFNTD